jgi:ABC-type polysaccharide/polyol phosphate export permease
MRSLAAAIPAIVLLQTLLGASYRYHALGVIWHIMNAMLVLLLILIVSVFLIRQFPLHPTLKPAAVSLAVVITSVLHVTTGALTFGTGYALAILIRYNIKGGRSLTGQ